jgi:hypothetical protein
VLQLSGHYLGASRAHRTFALIGGAENTEKLAWTRLAPGTYDYARMAKASDLEYAMEVTLIGPSGTQVVSSKKRAILDHTFVSRKPMTALQLEVPKGQWSFALQGRHANAKWMELENEKVAGKADLAWVKAKGLTPLDPAYVHVGKLAGTELETVTVLAKEGMVTIVRSGNDVFAQFEGSAVGGLKVNGQQFVLASSTDGVTPVWI